MERKCSLCDCEMFQYENFFRKTESLEIICGMCFEGKIEELKDKVFPVTVFMNDNWKKFVEELGMKV